MRGECFAPTGGRYTVSTPREHIPVVILPDHDAIAEAVAQEIIAYIQAQAAQKKKAVLGLATGSTPIGVYQKLVESHRRGMSFRHVITFNLDEYYPMSSDSLQSYQRYMHEYLFDHLDIPQDQVFIPTGDVPRDQVAMHCTWYEECIKQAGGIGIQVLGIGRTGHIGFNEPGSLPDTRTRLIRLDEITRKDAAADFFGEENVPLEAITMGVGTILDAQRILLIATGEHKAHIIKRAVEGEVSPQVAASYLQRHPNVTFYVDPAAGRELTRIKTPWLAEDPVDWTPTLAQRAVLWLCEQTNKPILHLQRRDYNEHHLYTLLETQPDVDALNKHVFEQIRAKIRERRDLFTGKRCVCFSPHPDDDVISMGGTLLHLAARENDITLAYMTSGNLAVFDADVLRQLDFIQLTLRDLQCAHQQFDSIADTIRTFLATKQPAQVDIPEIQAIKTNIRRSEAIAGAGTVGIPSHKTRFLDLPFYQTGQVKKNPIGEDDIRIILDLLNEVQPDVVFVAGDLSDPHGTHRMCKDAIERALQRDPRPRPEIWLYRGAWQEWEIDEADVFVPLSYDELSRKIQAIFKHESQKDVAMFPGAYDDREFWERVQDRNTATARLLDRLGLPQYYAIEAFVID
ncbi:MAG: glucosamine-6-phosphate deaminase [Candidatus Latescibacteria bacterium]|nr:glucosamine-6-phosphate deaminase [Candidatus Latescibacterota bacterium]